jgi:N utilization substance protein B
MTQNDETSRPIDERTDAREQAVMLLYEAEQRGVSALTLLDEREIASPELSTELISGVEKHRGELDEAIVAHAKGWALDRMPALDRAILRLGIFELSHRLEVPIAVVIDEAVELAKRFSTDDSGKFVNGILAAVAKKARPSGT